MTAGCGSIRSLALGPGMANASVDVVGGLSAITSPRSVPLTGAPRSVVLIVARQTPGLPTTVPLTITDDCGDWRTFVGGGPSAF